MTSTTESRRFGVNGGQAIKVPCRCATNQNVALDGGVTVDGVTVAVDDRILVRAQDDATENGIYLYRTGEWVRAPDFDGTYDVVGGTFVPVAEGTLFADTLWYVSNAAGPVVIDTDSITFALYLGRVIDTAAGGGLADPAFISAGSTGGLTPPQLLRAASTNTIEGAGWTCSTGDNTIAPDSTGRKIRDFMYQGYFETVQSVTSTTDGGLQFALRDGNVIHHLLTQDTTLLKPSDWPTSSDRAVSATLKITQNGTAGHAFSYSTSEFYADWGSGTTHAMSTAPASTDYANAVDTIVLHGIGSTAAIPKIEFNLTNQAASSHR